MNEHTIWLGLLLGLVPYWVVRQSAPGGVWSLEIRALFWSLVVRRQRNGRYDWALHLPLTERFRRPPGQP
jgi:hypothetical protein